MQIIDIGNILQAMFQILFSPLGLLLVGIVAARVAIDHFLPARRRRASPRSRLCPARSAPVIHSSGVRHGPYAQWKRYDEESLGEINDYSADEFEDFVAGLFLKQGYKASIVGGDGDHGVDIVLTNPKGERELVQCKRWDRRWIGEPIVRDFYGAFIHDGDAVRGYIVTTSVFSDAAWSWAEGKPIDLIDGKRLAESALLIG